MNCMTIAESETKMQAASILSQSVSLCLERKYLEKIVEETSPFVLKCVPLTSANPVTWISVNQVGKPLNDAIETSFTTIQKILFSCHLPKEMQLLFLVTGGLRGCKLYIGIRSIGETEGKKSFIKNFNEFLKGSWPGLQTEILDSDNSDIEAFCKSVNEDRLENVCALTGIPSMESGNSSLYPATVDRLIAGMSKCKKWAYFVIADPIAVEDTDNMLYQCRDINGKVESLKSFNISVGESVGTNESFAKTHTIGNTVSHSESETKTTTTTVGESVSRKDFKSFAGVAGILGGGALSAVGLLFPPAMPLIGAGFSVFNMASSIMPTKTKSKSFSESKAYGTTDTESHSESDAESHTTGTSESNTKTISQNVVNKHIEAIAEHLSLNSKRLMEGKAGGLWKVGTYLLTEKDSDLKGAALQLRSILSGKNSVYEPIRIHNISDLLDKNYRDGRTFRALSLGNCQSPVITVNVSESEAFHHPLGTHYDELKSVLTTKELSYLVNFPLHSVPGVSVTDSVPDFSLSIEENSGDDFVDFGRLLFGGSKTSLPYKIPTEAFAKHTLLSGINGSGKTNTVQSILNGLSSKIPFLVIEPAKTEYVDWAVEYNKTHPDSQISIFIPGCTNYRDRKTNKNITLEKLKLNPFELVWLNESQDPSVLSHIDRLKSTFAAAFPMYDILPILLEDLIYTIYQNRSTDWINRKPVFGKTLFPTLNSMSVCVDKVVSNRGYEERIERNMKACLNTRIDSLKRGWKGEMLNTLHSTSWCDLFEKKCVINLSYVGDDGDKSFFMALLLQFLYEYKIACAENGLVDFNSNACRHLTVVEEAHRVMMKCDNPEMPQYKSAMMFSNMLSEIRAYGEGLFLVDQVPTRLIPDAIKNTNVKITHRLVSEDDCRIIAESMGLTEMQGKMISKLLVGQSIVSSSLNSDKYLVGVNKVKGNVYGS